VLLWLLAEIPPEFCSGSFIYYRFVSYFLEATITTTTLSFFISFFPNKTNIFINAQHTGMSELVKERPANPIEFLASYLLANDPQKKTATSVPHHHPPR
jgi:hypothetical protein